MLLKFLSQQGGTDLAAHNTHFPYQPIEFGHGMSQLRSTVNTTQTLARKIFQRGAGVRASYDVYTRRLGCKLQRAGRIKADINVSIYDHNSAQKRRAMRPKRGP
jgi:hypothetical protein